MKTRGSCLRIITTMTVCLLTCCTVGQGQRARMDSLKRVLSKGKVDDSTRIHLLLSLADLQRSSGTDDAMRQAEKALELAERNHWKKQTAEALWMIGRCHAAKRQYQQAIDLIERGMNLSEELSDTRAVGLSLMDIGTMYYSMRDYARALSYFGKSHQALSTSGGMADIARVLSFMGSTSEKLQRYADAISSFEKCLAVTEELHDQAGIAQTLWRLGVLYDYAGQTDTSRRSFERSLQIATRAGEKGIIANALNSLGIICRNTGAYDEALEYLERSLQAHEAIPDRTVARRGIANTLTNIGDIHRLKGSYDKVLDYYRRSLRIRDELGDRFGMSVTYASMGNQFATLGEYDSALALYQRSLAISREIGDKGGVGRMCGNIGSVYFRTDRFEEALEYHEKALAIFEELGLRTDIGASLNHIASVYTIIDSDDRALEYLKRCLSIWEETGNQRGIAITLGNMAAVYKDLGEYERALQCCLRSLTISEDIGSDEVPRILYTASSIFISIGDGKKALEYGTRALAKFQSNGNAVDIALALYGVGNAHASLGELEQARAHYQRSLEIYREHGGESGVAANLAQLGNLLIASGDGEKGLEQVRESLRILETLHYKDFVHELLIQGNALSEMRAYGAAELYYLRALEKARALGSKNRLCSVHRALGEHYELTGSMERALSHLKEFQACKDTLLNATNLRSINEMSAKYEAERKDNAIRLLEKDRALKDLALARQEENLRLRGIEAQKARQDAELLRQQKQIAELDRARADDALLLEREQGARKRAEAEMWKNNDRLKAAELDKQYLTRNALLAVLALLAIVAVLAFRRLQGKRREALLRARAAEYQAKAMEVEAVEREHRAQQAFSRGLITAQEQERQRIAGELHDSLGQQLVVIKNRTLMALAALENPEKAQRQLEQVAEMSAQALSGVREISHALRPSELDRLGLTAAIRGTVQTVAETSGMHVTTEIDAVDGVFRKEDEINVYRIVQEALGNVLKHARATETRVQMKRQNGDVRIEIADNGRGFRRTAEDGTTGGFGLAGMEQRVRMMGGDISIDSATDKGTRIAILIRHGESTHDNRTAGGAPAEIAA